MEQLISTFTFEFSILICNYAPSFSFFPFHQTVDGETKYVIVTNAIVILWKMKIMEGIREVRDFFLLLFIFLFF